MTTDIIMPTPEAIAKSLAPLIARELDARRTVDEKTHAQHHDFIEHKINASRRHDALIEDMKKNALVWAMLGVFFGVFGLVVYWFEHWPRGVGHG